MHKMRTRHFLTGLILVLGLSAESLAQSASRSSDDREKITLKAYASSLSDIDTLARADERVEALRTKLVDLQMLEMNLQIRLDDLDYRMSPEIMQWALSFVGSVRPMDERRVFLRNRLESEKTRVSTQLEHLGSARERLNALIQEAELDRDRLRQRLGIEQ